MIDYTEKIPNNVDLGRDRVLQRALEHWQPAFLGWWSDMSPQRILQLRGLPAHRHQRRARWLGAIRLRPHARISLGNFSSATRRTAPREFRPPQRPGRVARSPRRISLRSAPRHRHARRHRARIRRAAKSARPLLPVSLRSPQHFSGQCRRRPPPLGDGLSSSPLFRSRRS